MGRGGGDRFSRTPNACVMLREEGPLIKVWVYGMLKHVTLRMGRRYNGMGSRDPWSSMGSRTWERMLDTVEDVIVDYAHCIDDDFQVFFFFFFSLSLSFFFRFSSDLRLFVFFLFARGISKVEFLLVNFFFSMSFLFLLQWSVSWRERDERGKGRRK